MAYPFVQARNYTRTKGRSIDLIVVHDMEAPEALDTAERVARWFAGSTAPQASAHYCLDTNSVVQCVRDIDVAWHAPGSNHNSIGLEHAGYARQRPAEWDDPYSKAMLALSVQLVKTLCTQYKIPAEYVDAAGIKAGKRGITTHYQVSLAWGRSTHYDPGAGFPMANYIEQIKGSTPSAPAVVEGVVVVNRPPVALIPHPNGYWEITEDGGVFAFAREGAGEVPFYGSLGATTLNAAIVDAAPTPDFGGYWLVAADGGVFGFGNAVFYGSAGGTPLNKPIKCMAVAADGKGYGLMGTDGGIFAFGSFAYAGRVDYPG